MSNEVFEGLPEHLIGFPKWEYLHYFEFVTLADKKVIMLCNIMIMLLH